MKPSPQSGFSLIELMVGLVVSSIVMGAAYSLWKTHQVEGYRLEKKIELRNVMTLSGKRIQRAVTLAGFGLSGAPPLANGESAGSDTLSVFSNMAGGRTTLLTGVLTGATTLTVTDASLFQNAAYLALSNDTNAEIHRIISHSGSQVSFDAPLAHDYASASCKVMPASRERYYTNQESNTLVRETEGAVATIAKDVKDFQVSFRDQNGAATTVAASIRSVVFSFTGIFPAGAGALNSIQFSSTAIPRNTL